jgi:hypothetical protein
MIVHVAHRRNSAPPERTDRLVAQVSSLDQIISVRLQRDISRQPAADVLTVAITDGQLPQLMCLLSDMGCCRTRPAVPRICPADPSSSTGSR